MKYNVYGIGNALVDMEFSITPEFLKDMKIDKGVMTLVDQKRQDFLLQCIKEKEKKRSAGGSAANTIIALAQLGGSGFYSCKVAKDEAGEFFYKDLVEAGVDTNVKDHRPPGVTGKCLVFITPDADRTMNSYLGITWAFSKKELVKEHFKRSQYLYIEGYLVASASAKEAAILAKKTAAKTGCKTALTFSDINMVTQYKEELLEVIDSGVDILFCNEDEAKGFTESPSLEKAAHHLHEISSQLVITLGAQGMFYSGNGENFFLPSPQVEAVDTNGAGDMFAGAFLYGITHGYDPKTSARLACATASHLVSQYGPRLSKEEVLAIKKEILG